MKNTNVCLLMYFIEVITVSERFAEDGGSCLDVGQTLGEVRFSYLWNDKTFKLFMFDNQVVVCMKRLSSWHCQFSVYYKI